MFGRLGVLALAIVFINFEHATGENVWCYQCNTDLEDGHKGDCNDPYTPIPSLDLVSCPQNESYHCIKSVVLYKNVLVTVRGCVPSRAIDGYCRHEEYFPESSIECSFCKDYACNRQGSHDLYSSWSLGLFGVVLALASKLLT